MRTEFFYDNCQACGAQECVVITCFQSYCEQCGWQRFVDGSWIRDYFINWILGLLTENELPQDHQLALSRARSGVEGELEDWLRKYI